MPVHSLPMEDLEIHSQEGDMVGAQPPVNSLRAMDNNHIIPLSHRLMACHHRGGPVFQTYAGQPGDIPPYQGGPAYGSNMQQQLVGLHREHIVHMVLHQQLLVTRICSNHLMFFPSKAPILVIVTTLMVVRGGHTQYGSTLAGYGEQPVPNSAGYGYPVTAEAGYSYHLLAGVLIGKAGETIRLLHNNSGAKIQITRGADSAEAERPVELIVKIFIHFHKAEKLIRDVIQRLTQEVLLPLFPEVLTLCRLVELLIKFRYEFQMRRFPGWFDLWEGGETVT